MSQWRSRVLIAAAGFFLGVLAGYSIFVPSKEVLDRRVQQQRKDHELVLRTFKATYSPGMTRAQVEARLKQTGIAFNQSCCVQESRTVRVRDIVLVGYEDSQTWVCGPWSAYVAFIFTRDSQLELEWDADKEDVLREVSV